MKNLINFYTAVMLPLLSLVLLAQNGLSSFWFFVLLMAYALVYHPFISGIRLLRLGIIKKRQLVYCFIPGWNVQYFSQLFLNRL